MENESKDIVEVVITSDPFSTSIDRLLHEDVKVTIKIISPNSPIKHLIK